MPLNGLLDVVDLRVDGLPKDVLAVVEQPCFSWALTGSGRGRAQSAYQILVGRQSDPLDGDGKVVWDSGIVTSRLTNGIGYAGKPLAPRTRYAWRVRVADEADVFSDWSQAAWFETGLEAGTWTACWIAAPETPRSERLPSLDNVPRIWPAEPAQVAWFRSDFVVPHGSRPLAATLVATGAVTAYLNGVKVEGDTADGAWIADLLSLVAPGPNVLAIEATAADDENGGLAVRVEVQLEGRNKLPHLVPVAADAAVTLTSSGRWRAVATSCAGWERPEFDDSAWPLADEVGLYGDPPWGRVAVTDRPSPYLRRSFIGSGQVARARLYATALGIYHVFLNGIRVGEDRLAPGWTDYRHRLTYQTYDVTALLAEGENVLAAVLADGWYAGQVGWFGPYQYGRRLALRAELEIVYTDGAVVRIATGDQWRAGQGAIRYADLQNGERQDAAMEPPGWTLPGFDDSTWPVCREVNGVSGRLVPQLAPPIRVQHELAPQALWQSGPQTWIADFGQNLVGWVRLRATGIAGQRVVVRHAEVLDHQRGMHTANLRSARATDEFVFTGLEQETFEPQFTVHGFRYAEISGVCPEEIVARVAYADMPQTGTFSCSDERINQLQANIVWGQRGNFLSIPTDCPQRDERLGWTGDIWAFAPTALFNYDAGPFLRSWLEDVADAQTRDGAVTHVVPVVPSQGLSEAGSPGWGDAIVMVPWAIHRVYDDKRMLERLYDPMRRWVAYLEARCEDGIFPDEGFGDWLNLGADTPKSLVGTAVFALTTRQLAELGEAAGHADDVERLHVLHSRVRAAFRRRFVDGPGRVAGGTQTAYVLALAAGMFDDGEIPRAAANLVRDIEARGNHLSTGFLGTPFLLDTLTQAGHHDVAMRLLLQDTYPSWLYPIVHGGATTMWERWDSWSHHRGLQDPGMNSFNHYAYGAVGDWLYRTIGGLEPASPGYREVVLRPRIGGGITAARTAYQSVHGLISVAWTLADDVVTVEAEVPVNVEARVWIPARRAQDVSEAGTVAAQANGVRLVGMTDGCAVLAIGSGRYHFTSRLHGC